MPRNKAIQMRQQAIDLCNEYQQELEDALAVESVKPFDLEVCNARMNLRNSERVLIALNNLIQHKHPY